jgi:hypothetical protein
MTQLIEQYKITVTLNHDAVDSVVYSGATDLSAQLEKFWPCLLPAMQFRDGRMQALNGAIDVRWEYTGKEEAPEVGGGDN